jgi:hypothetical protein
VVTLLLHQHRAAEALAQFRTHMSLFRILPFQDAPHVVQASHWAWVGRQYATMAELLASRVNPDHLPTQVTRGLMCMLTHWGLRTLA